jgi:hypothetical protein
MRKAQSIKREGWILKKVFLGELDGEAFLAEEFKIFSL